MHISNIWAQIGFAVLGGAIAEILHWLPKKPKYQQNTNKFGGWRRSAANTSAPSSLFLLSNFEVAN